MGGCRHHCWDIAAVSAGVVSLLSATLCEGSIGPEGEWMGGGGITLLRCMSYVCVAS
jgi:hypothetical protein